MNKLEFNISVEANKEKLFISEQCINCENNCVVMTVDKGAKVYCKRYDKKLKLKKKGEYSDEG